jgi:hypothetical protein
MAFGWSVEQWHGRLWQVRNPWKSLAMVLERHLAFPVPQNHWQVDDTAAVQKTAS